MVSRIELVIEGGSRGRKRKAPRIDLRRGMDTFVERALSISGSDIVHSTPAYGRTEALSEFVGRQREATDPDALYVLLIDSETSMPAPGDPWEVPTDLSGCGHWDQALCDVRRIHFMTMAMEAWFAADRAALRAYAAAEGDRQPVDERGLPEPGTAESVAPSALARCLDAAIPSGYGKTWSGGALLAALDPATVRKHCAWCERFLGYLEMLLATP